MSTVSWLLVVGSKKIPVRVIWWNKSQAYIELIENNERGLAGERLIVHRDEVVRLEQTSFVVDENRYDQLPLFEVSR